MAQTEDEAGKPLEDETFDDVPIGRDPNFARMAADGVIVINRAADFELSLIAEGPDPTAQFVKKSETGALIPRGVRLSGTYTEVGRVRLSPPIALRMAMEIIENSLDSGNVRVPAFRAAVIALFDQYEEKGSTETASD